MDWIKDFFTTSGNLTARFYRVCTEPVGKYELTYNGCTNDISFYYNRQSQSIKVGSIFLSLQNTRYIPLFCEEVKTSYGIPKYITEYIVKYFCNFYK